MVSTSIRLGEVQAPDKAKLTANTNELPAAA
jgi:hypothetical protein